MNTTRWLLAATISVALCSAASARLGPLPQNGEPSAPQHAVAQPAPAVTQGERDYFAATPERKPCQVAAKASELWPPRDFGCQ